MDRAQLALLADRGIAFDATIAASIEYLDNEQWKGNFQMAMDAVPSLITASNAGIPAYLANLLDPEVVRILVTPMKAVEIFGETKKGDWTTQSTQFPVVESTGEVSSYGDHNNNGSAGANVNWVARQSYHYQTVTQWGELELERYGLAKINYASEMNVASALVLSKFQNKSYFYGVAGLANYGALNDPALIAPIAPATKVAGGTLWANATAQEIYNDFLKLFEQLQTQMGFNVPDMEAKMTVAMSPISVVSLSKVSIYNVTARQTIQENFPNLTIKTAPEYATGGGNLMQLILDEVEGVETTYCAFTEKMRAHPVIADMSAWKQKKSGGTWGAIIRRPIAIAQMLGI
jgi:hypothetical protein